MTGIVLSGGGARGAYEAGVVAGIVEVLRHDDALPRDRPLFRVFSGTSVGAINAAWLAAHADRPDMNVGGLLDSWRQLAVETHLQLDVAGLLGLRDILPALARRLGLRHPIGKRWGRSLLESHAFEELVCDRIPWVRLHDNIQRKRVAALVVAALQISTGRTTMFVELAPGGRFRPSRDPRRSSHICSIGSEHVLASAAIPFLFPARRIGRSHYCDGGLRFNTPISPAIRCGAERLVVVPLLHLPSTGEQGRVVESREAAYPSPFFLLGKVLNALLLDPIDYDLHVLERLNRLIGTLERAVDEQTMAQVRRVLEETRGLSYRRIDNLVFRPSTAISQIASVRARELRAGRASSRLLARAARVGTTVEADLLSFILFDGGFAERLIEMGRQDAWARYDEIHAFFASGPRAHSAVSAP